MTWNMGSNRNWLSSRLTRAFVASGVFVAGVVVSGCEGVSPCETNFECPLGEICTDGVCTEEVEGDPSVEPADGPPETTFDESDILTNALTVDVGFSCDQAPCTFECKADTGEFRACTSPHAFEVVGEGAHTLFARAINVDNRVDDSAAEATLTVDQTAPVLTVGGRPDALTTSRDATLTFACDEDCTTRCALNTGASTDCNGTFSIAGAADGTHVVSVVATDTAGNVAAAVEVEWVVDATAPALSLTEQPDVVTSEQGATFAFTCDDANACATTCSVDGGSVSACESPFLLPNLSEGAHTFALVGTDAVGNISAPLEYSWTVDITGPTTTVNTSPDATTEDFELAITFECDEAPCTLECRLDGGAFEACSSPYTLVGVNPGAHSVSIRGVDAAGNVEAAPSVVTWTQTRTWTDVAASHHFCAIAGNGSLWCWGDNAFGQVGLGDVGGSIAAPFLVGTDNDWVDVANGEFHSCAIKSEGSLWCWGRNNFGQLGLGMNAPDEMAPVRVGTSLDWASVWRDGASALHSCALSTADVYCWGRNVDGEVGIGSDDDVIWVPSVVAVASVQLEVSLAAGRTTSSPSLFFWGLDLDPAQSSSVPSHHHIEDQGGLSDEVVDAAASACVSTGFNGGVLAWARESFTQFERGLCSFGDTGEYGLHLNFQDGTCPEPTILSVSCGPDYWIAQFGPGGIWAFADSTMALGLSSSGPLEENNISPARVWSAVGAGYLVTLFIDDSAELWMTSPTTGELVAEQIP